MNLRLFSLAALGATALMASFPLNAAAAEARSGGDGFFATPLLSRLLPNLATRSDNLVSSPALTTRFHLGYFATGPTNQTTGNTVTAAGGHLNQRPVRESTSSVAALDYGSFYGASRLDLNRFSDSVNTAYSLPRPEENLGLSLEAGMKHDDLSAGILYAYRNNYSPLESVPGRVSYPGYIFTPTGGGLDNALDESPHQDNHALFLYMGYDLSRQLNLRGTLGLARTSSRPEDGGNRLGEQSRRWGVDIAASYKLLDNLVYEAHLGYVNIDDSTSGAGQAVGSSDGAPLSSGSAPTSLYHIGSHIRMTF